MTTMTTSSKEEVILKPLLEYLFYSRNSYELLALDAKNNNSDIRDLFDRLATKRQTMLNTLSEHNVGVENLEKQELIEHSGGERPVDNELQQIYNNIKDSFASGNTQTISQEIKQEKLYLIDKYKQILQNKQLQQSSLPQKLKDLLLQQLNELEELNSDT
ncbi:unnamed protein product [Didymodactylos carnosus]|uniref:DUF2383 domain-containing protein n=1 Tax=Didymodactylos carnosus TaxID=1234261 RepID=A0A815CFM2_9BILA|nr:unnamed protein product [Didymodactylos carnosus]CAF1424180.1 unnamed protein product [Didymodactylos carnosus]CAF4083254.1 unnamed protein product [Didymodactylos carnosus]CAF4223845.1 unnamed protein product [Didymodactylos carnosus]